MFPEAVVAIDSLLTNPVITVVAAASACASSALPFDLV
jgi:hypothetical protein